MQAKKALSHELMQPASGGPWLVQASIQDALSSKQHEIPMQKSICTQSLVGVADTGINEKTMAAAKLMIIISLLKEMRTLH